MKNVPKGTPVDGEDQVDPGQGVEQAHAPQLEVQRDHVREERHEQAEHHQRRTATVRPGNGSRANA